MVESKKRSKLDEIIKLGLEKDVLDIQLASGSTPRFAMNSAVSTERSKVVSTSSSVKAVRNELTRDEILEFAEDLLDMNELSNFKKGKIVNIPIKRNGVNMKVNAFKNDNYASIVLRVFYVKE